MKRLYFASFLPGLEAPMERLLRKTGGLSPERMLTGGVLFRSNRTPELQFVRQCFLVLFQMKPSSSPDEALRRLLTAGEWLNAIPYEEIAGKRFRITVSDGDKKIPANMRYVALLEKAIEEHTGMRVHREHPDTELWLLLRREASYFLMRIPSKETGGKGRMRPDVAGAIALLMGYNPGKVALLGTADAALIRMLREQGARQIAAVPAESGDESLYKQAKIRLISGTPEHTDLADESCNGICLCLSVRKDASPAFDLRGALHESARILARKGALVLVAPQQHALEIVERNRSFETVERLFCNWGGNRMLIFSMRLIAPEEA